MAKKARRPAKAADAGNGSSHAMMPAVVGIGASAGGLAALRTFLEHTPDDTGLSFVVVVHLAPGHESHLADLLQSSSTMPVTQVRESVPLEPNQVYVIPPGHHLSAVDSHVRPTVIREPHGERAHIDHFFRTLADTYDGHTIGIVLTGTGSDGAMGLRRIKEKGGITIVQDPSEAEFDGMPRAAIATGLVDLVLPIQEMPRRIAALLEVRPEVRVSEDTAALDADNERIFQHILAQLRARSGHDFSGYKRTTIGRRLERRMQIRQTLSLKDYLGLLRADGVEVQSLAADLLINVTSFFRDAAVFDKLTSDVLPPIFAARGPNDRVRVWSVGCATGEEAYSLAMVLLEEAARHESPPQIQIFATDLHEMSLRHAREGHYPDSIELDVSRERLDRFFVRERDGYRVRREVRDLIVFASHNVMKDPPFTRVDFVSCRNLLIYVQRDVQDQIISVFHYALREGGYLMLGSAETVERGELFRMESKPHFLYRRRDSTVVTPRLSPFPALPTRHREAQPPLIRADEELRSYGALHARIVEQYAPPSMLISEDNGIVHLSEQAGRYLLHPGGALTNNVFSLVREELRIELRAGLHAARHAGPWVSEPIGVPIDGAERRIVLRIRAGEQPEDRGFFLVIFDEVGIVPIAPKQPGVVDPTMAEMEAELAMVRERLQAIIEEYESSQEEMRASNEELQSMNEELRSTMEELETSKEELQSINEELQTVNQENRHRVEELSHLSADLQNLLTSTDIATLFLDRSFRILRFTPRVKDFLSVRHTDRGRPLGDLTHRLGYPQLIEDARAVLERLTPVEREVSDDQGRSYLARILPYRSTDDRIEGVVLTFVDITARKEAEEQLRHLNETLEQRVDERTHEALEHELRFRTLVEASAQIVWTTDAEGHFVEDSPSWRAFTGETAAEWLTDGWPTAIHPEERADRRREWLDGIRHDAPVDLFFRLRHISGDWRWMHVRAVALRDASGSVNGWVGMNTDVTATIEAERLLRETRSRLTVAEQHERRRIAEILHNDLQQRLYGLQLKLDTLRHTASRGADPEQIRSVSEEAVGWIRQTIDVVRRLSVDLNPPILQGESLEDLLVWLQAQMQEMHGLRVDLDIAEALPIPAPEIRILLLQSLRELLFNVVKHAGVKRASLAARAEKGDLVVSVSDAGSGLTTPDGAAATGYGLFSIRDRLLLLGGDMKIASPPGGGTTVTLCVPLAQPDRSPASL